MAALPEDKQGVLKGDVALGTEMLFGVLCSIWSCSDPFVAIQR